jgi:hypothetical protein
MTRSGCITQKRHHQKMKATILQIGILVLFQCAAAICQGSRYDSMVSTHIELRKDTLLLGEPTFFDYVINNNSNETIYVEEGGDYRSGRKISFKVFVISSENDTLKMRELWGGMGGFIRFHPISPGGSRKFKLFLPMWADIEKPGTYRLAVSKRFRIAPENPFLKEDYSTIQVVPKASDTTFTVVEDAEKLGKFIADLVTDIKEETQGRTVESGAFRTSRNTYISISEKLSDYMRFIEEIKDERLIPFLVESFREKKYIAREKSNYLLANFSKNDTAFETLVYAAQTEENTPCFVSDDSIGITWSTSYIRQNALQGIMRSDNDRAVHFLLSKKDDDYPCERYMIVIRAKYIMSESNAGKVYAAFLSDSNKAVRRKAQAELDKLKKE